MAIRTVRAGSLLPLLLAPLFSLSASGDGDAPYSEQYVFEGFVGCSVGFAPLQTQDQCGAVLNEGESRHQFWIPSGLTAASVRLFWPPPAPTEGELNPGGTLALTWLSPAGMQPNHLHGHSPVRRHYSFTEHDTFTLIGANGTLDVRAANGGEAGEWDEQPSFLVVRQRYELCVNLYFDGAEDLLPRLRCPR